MNLSKEKKVMIKAANGAAKILLKFFNKKLKFSQKSNKSFVSEADIAANDAIIKTIKNTFPNHNILSEEIPFEDAGSQFTWVIDPLDGTHNFIHGIEIYGTTIGLKYKDEVVLGMIIMPSLKLTVFAEKGKGAFVNGKRMKVSKTKNIDHSFLLFEFSFTGRKKKLAMLEGMIGRRLDLRNLGCAVYHLYLVAAGKADAYVIHHTNDWDVAAGLLAISEAGGAYSDLKGKKADISAGNFIASNGKIHSSLVKFIKKH